MTSASVVDVRDLQKTYTRGFLAGRRVGVQALRGVSLTAKSGDVFGLLGPNGAGKTTLIKTLLGVVKPSGGTAFLFDQPVGTNAARKRVGYLPETLRVDRHHTARSALKYYGRLSQMDAVSIQRRSDELLELVGLSGRDRESVRQFSKGMYQRLGLAQALMHDPDLLFLDEPTDGLDPVGRNEVRKVIDRLRGLGKTIFLNSHILQEVELVCTRVAIMANGKILASGSMGSEGASQDDGLNQSLMGQQDQGGPVTFDLIAPNRDLALESFFEPLRQATLSVEPLTSSAATHRVVATPRSESPITQPQLDAVVDKLRSGNISIVRLDAHVPTLEDTFMRLVQAANQVKPVTQMKSVEPQP